jgi:hypothetical protein
MSSLRPPSHETRKRLPSQHKNEFIIKQKFSLTDQHKQVKEMLDELEKEMEDFIK